MDPKGGLGIEPRFVSRPSRSLVTIPTELSKLLLQLFSYNYVFISTAEAEATPLACFRTYSTEHRPSAEANRFSASQKIPRILWSQKVHYRVYKCLPPVPIPSQIDPAYAPLPHPAT